YGIQHEEVELITQDKVKIRIYVLQQFNEQTARRRPTILTFHGHCIPIAERFYNDFRCNVVMLSYRGYGRSEGTPSER
ncbi:11757_t:CDS:2, partial [Racocetra persica]